MINRQELTTALKAEVVTLVDDLRVRSDEVDEIRELVHGQWRTAFDAERTAHDVDVWREGLLAQVAVSWVLGCVFIKEREIFISDRIRNDGRFRFTCAHELGHMVLHANKGQNFHERGDLEPGSKIEIEREADRFAVGFLMPNVELIVQLREIVNDHALDLEPTLLTITGESTESRKLWSGLLVPELCRRFDVSMQALIYRLQEIRFRDGTPMLPKRIASQLVRHGSAPTDRASSRH